VYSTNPGETVPTFCCTAAARASSAAASSGRKRRCRCGELHCPDTAFSEDILDDGYGGHRVRPARIKCQMRDNFGDLARFDTIVEREIEVMRHVDRFDRGQSGPPRSRRCGLEVTVGTLPKIVHESTLRVTRERRGHHLNIPSESSWTCSCQNRAGPGSCAHTLAGSARRPNMAAVAKHLCRAERGVRTTRV